MLKRMVPFISAVGLAVLASCIASDQLTTITIHPDGSADLVKFLSNIRSTEPGSKGAQELKQFVEQFDARRDGDSLRITKAGGELVEARWLRREEPFAAVLAARFRTRDAFLEFFTARGEKGEVVVQPRFTEEGSRRRLSLTIPVPEEKKPEQTESSTVETLRQEQANGLSETRLVAAGGRITASQGFTVAADRRSALIEPTEIQRLLRKGGEKVEVYLEWELATEPPAPAQ